MNTAGSIYGRILAIGMLPAFCSFGASVRITVQMQTDETVALTNLYFTAGQSYEIAEPPAVTGWTFTRWDISTQQPFVGHDNWGRAYEKVSVPVYEDTVFTARFIANSVDTDADGIPDAMEEYWYGTLARGADDDSDGDGLPFAEELAKGLNPHFPDSVASSDLLYADTPLALFNPSAQPPYTIRCEPEGLLFDTIREYVTNGTPVVTSTGDPVDTPFVGWRVDGVIQRDEFCRALDSYSFVMATTGVDVVAICETNKSKRLSLYWYGNEDVPLDSDTDGDGMTFAEELALGTNPLFADAVRPSDLMYADTGVSIFNPHGWEPYVIRSVPENSLFEKVEDYVAPGTIVSSPHIADASTFAEWRVDGVSQRDEFGRALDSIEFVMPSNRIEVVAYSVADEIVRASRYWYGMESIDMNSDTDGDGKTFAEELRSGTNPHFAESVVASGLLYADTSSTEVDLQRYEAVSRFIVDGRLSSPTFPTQIWPVVADLDGDGLWDLVVVGASATNVFLNVGARGNPEFVADKSGALGDRALPFVGMNSTAKLAAFSLDVAAPTNALSATLGDADRDGIEDLLVSDADGRIWYYQGTPGTEGASAPETLSFVLQHKVWGGSHPGFAQGLRLAAVDWEDDGDLDCLAGTADGKLMLLRDPKVGRPTNLKAFAGVDNVLLTWDPNAQSRIKGYRVYGAPAETAGFERIAQPQLPTCRDFPDGRDARSPSGEYAYKVSSVSRFYTAGNSTPTETESMPTEPVAAKLGSVKFFWNDAVAKAGEPAAVMLSIENSMNYNVAGLSQTVVYDPEYLTPKKVVKSGLAEGFDVQCAVVRDGEWQITIAGAVGGGTPILPAGGGKFLTLVFETQKAGVTTVGGETGATVSIAAASARPPYQLGDVDGDGDVDVDDLRLLAKLKNGTGRKYTANQLKAGDFNGNGKLDNADYQALRALLKERGAL